MLAVDRTSVFEKMAEEKALYLDVDCDPKLPSKLIGDERYILQIVSNLVSNAIKYTKKGSVSVYADSVKNETGAFMLRFTVSDTGIGIDEKDVPFLFEAFRRLNEKENATIQGTGLGLAITKDLVELMEGTISVKSEHGKGTVFTMSIPQKISDATPNGPFLKKLTGDPISYHESFRAPEAEILIVDDVEVNIIVIAELLKMTGVRIDTATGGDEAIRKCLDKKYDLILLDHRMPQKDGIETFREIMREGDNIDTPTIMLTANAMAGAREEYRKLGFADYLTKPVDSRELENMLIKYLPRQKVILN